MKRKLQNLSEVVARASDVFYRKLDNIELIKYNIIKVLKGM